MQRKLRSVNRFNFADVYTLYRLLAERTPEQSISHKAMPTMSEHVAFVESEPYRAWNFIIADHIAVGAVYLTDRNELGIAVFQAYRGHGHAKWALEEMMRTHEGPFLANINPRNGASISLFTRLGFDLLQETYSHE